MIHRRSGLVWLLDTPSWRLLFSAGATMCRSCRATLSGVVELLGLTTSLPPYDTMPPIVDQEDVEVRSRVCRDGGRGVNRDPDSVIGAWLPSPDRRPPALGRRAYCHSQKLRRRVRRHSILAASHGRAPAKASSTIDC